MTHIIAESEHNVYLYRISVLNGEVSNRVSCLSCLFPGEPEIFLTVKDLSPSGVVEWSVAKTEGAEWLKP
jgi:hypothetical protein